MAEYPAGTTPRRFHIVKIKFHFWIPIVTLLTSLVKVSEQLNTRGREDVPRRRSFATRLVRDHVG